MYKEVNDRNLVQLSKDYAESAGTNEFILLDDTNMAESRHDQLDLIMVSLSVVVPVVILPITLLIFAVVLLLIYLQEVSKCNNKYILFNDVMKTVMLFI